MLSVSHPALSEARVPSSFRALLTGPCAYYSQRPTHRTRKPTRQFTNLKPLTQNPELEL